jgi:hypothetical protein
MDPEINSIVTSVLLAISTAVAGWAVSNGIISTADQSNLANQIVAVVGGVVAVGVGWYKKRQVTPTAMIKAINDAPNGVKVVAAVSASPQVEAPVKIGAK